MATKVTVTFRPASTDTAIVVRCAGSIVFTFETTPVGRGSTGDLCGPDGVRGKHDDKRYGPGWVGRPRTITFWVFPPDAPILGAVPRPSVKSWSVTADTTWTNRGRPSTSPRGSARARERGPSRSTTGPRPRSDEAAARPVVPGARAPPPSSGARAPYRSCVGTAAAGTARL